MRLLIDANLSPLVTGALLDAGHDVVHVADLGLLTASDLVILERAGDDERVVVSSDSDFAMLLATHGRRRPSLVLLRHLNELAPQEQARLLVATLPAVADELARGAVVTLARGRVRVRSLPL